MSYCLDLGGCLSRRSDPVHVQGGAPGRQLHVIGAVPMPAAAGGDFSDRLHVRKLARPPAHANRISRPRNVLVLPVVLG
jgi:hypothetical protein